MSNKVCSRAGPYDGLMQGLQGTSASPAPAGGREPRTLSITIAVTDCTFKSYIVCLYMVVLGLGTWVESLAMWAAAAVAVKQNEALIIGLLF